VQQTTAWIRDLDARFATPTWSFVKRWRYSQPRNTIEFDQVNTPNSHLVICGDATARGRVPDAWDSGVKAAKLSLAQVS
jgi:predicted NAD/FAD-dependent oxidoreductase